MIIFIPCLILAGLLFIIPRDHDVSTAHFLKRIFHSIACALLSFWVGGGFSDMANWDDGAAIPGAVLYVMGFVFLIRFIWFSGALLVYLLRKKL